MCYDEIVKKIFLLIFLLLSNFFPKYALAGTDRCDLLTEGTKIADSDLYVILDDQRPDISQDKVYNGRLFVFGTGVVSGGTGNEDQGGKAQEFTMNNGSYRFGPVKLGVGTVSIRARELNGESFLNCSNNPTSFEVRSPNDKSPICEVKVGGKLNGSSNAHEITFTASNLQDGNNHAYLDWRTGNRMLINETFSGTSYSKIVTQELTRPPTNQQDIINGRITKEGVQNTPQNALCESQVTVASDVDATPSPSPTPPPPPCDKGFDKDGHPTTVREEIASCSEINTALGFPFSTDPGEFVKTIFGIVLSLAGGIAILLIIFSGYGLMFSQGNPEKVQAAREQLTAAIVGLLFIIFSMSILQIIGVDILHIPGLTR